MESHFHATGRLIRESEWQTSFTQIKGYILEVRDFQRLAPQTTFPPQTTQRGRKFWWLQPMSDSWQNQSSGSFSTSSFPWKRGSATDSQSWADRAPVVFVVALFWLVLFWMLSAWLISYIADCLCLSLPQFLTCTPHFFLWARGSSHNSYLTNEKNPHWHC